MASVAKFLTSPNVDIYGGGTICHIIKTLMRMASVELLSFDFDSLAEIMGENYLPKSLHMLGNREIGADPPFSVYKRENIIKLLKTYKATTKYDYLFSTQMISAFETTLLKTPNTMCLRTFPRNPL
jgi:hypothetical protein